MLPEPDESIREIYQRGLTLGNDPNAFSIFGDCQSRPEEFFGVFETDPLSWKACQLNCAKRWNVSTARSTAKVPPHKMAPRPAHCYGTSGIAVNLAAPLLKHQSNANFASTARLSSSFKLAHTFESRNTEYLRKIITQLINEGVVPILATKADNRELDDRVNRDMALLADEFNLPLWNFWASLSDLPDRGLYVMDGREEQGAVYLNEEAQEIHRITGLEALNIVWRVAAGN